MATISFKPKQVTKRLLSAIPERAREVLEYRYGLDARSEPSTLEAIGAMYGITRERVRQIESHALASIQKSDAFAKEKSVFNELAHLIGSLGGVVVEGELLEHISKDPSTQNHVHFLLVVGDSFTREKEDAEFRRRWYVDKDLADRIHRSLKNVYQNLSDDDLIPESEMISRFLEEVKDLSEHYKQEEMVRRWLGLAKTIDRNPLGEWGVAASPNVHAKGMRDYAYLAIKRHGSPMHFTEVAAAIAELFSRKAHVATCHNELIKDSRFVLVGRGLYALAEWGYSAGVVKDVIREVLRKHGPLTRDEVIEKVKKERYVKDNTILVNLQDARAFAKDDEGRYTVAD